MYKNNTAYSLAAIIVFAMVITAVNYHGSSNRIFASGKETLLVDSPKKAYAIWQERRVKGRILLLFDNYPHMMGRFNYAGEPQLGESNLIEFSIFKNVIRKIYFIIPETLWEDFVQQKTTKAITSIATLEKGIFLYNLNGLPIIATTPSSLPHIDEEALVYINNSVFDASKTRELLAQKKITSDIIIMYRTDSK